MNNKPIDKNIQIKLESLNLPKKTLETILEHIRVARKRLDSVENIINEAQRAQYSPSRDMPGELGVFDGEYLVTQSGVKYEVPKNYAAKSLLIVGDELKRYQEENVDKYVIFNKIPRKKVKGTLSKKDGRYFVLLENNKSYQLSKSAVEFRNLKQGDEVLVVIPETDNGSDFAAIDKLATQSGVNLPSKKIKPIEIRRAPQMKTETKDNKPALNETIQIETPKKTERVDFSDEDLL